ncbi:Endonuclease/exonuclease/phosphatase-like protein [Cercophora newfieldiana]|uniref:Endonuclease/exonuclease/phosphatase-like protein n=1 Tax=Cercophora newfieldiana TaxID=92897 RepID=A0AA39XUV6_9PEZI|nr:Endonuclease/exonuclease/phosphatase-like protein [Cercophora newfieldiana]
MKVTSSFLLGAIGLQRLAAALTIAEINGNKFLSPYSGQTVTNVTGLLVAKGPNGVWIRSTTPDDDPTTSEAIYVFGSVGANVTVGDIISLDGKVTEYRAQTTYLYLTEITSPKNVKVISSGNTVTPLVIGKDTPSPPTKAFSGLDGGDIYNLPGGVANLSVVNPVLKPKEYGLDFWESLSGELVTVRKPTAIQRPNNYRDTWVYGDWAVTGKNKHGGLTMSADDSNPEVIIIGTPLDGTKNPTTTKMGDQFEDVTGIVQNAFGFYNILPLTALKTSSSVAATAGATTLKTTKDCRGLTVGDYNVENLAPNSAHLPKIAAHIIDYLKTPDLIFIQEIQDGSGPTDDGVVSANATLSALTASIESLSGVSYAFASVDPANNLDGGQPGGNIRQAYLYRPEVVTLYKPNQGSGSDATVVQAGPKLSFNPGRIEPDNEAWAASRKPIAAAWVAKGSKKPFFTVNVHFSSKGGGTSLHGDVRPPLNGAVAKRMLQANVTATFIAGILRQRPKAKVIAAGDFNEFSFVGPMKTFTSVSGMVDLDEAAKIPVLERYTYAYDMNAQALDHMYVSPELAKSKSTKYEHLHVNSWAASADMVSDHDPSVALFDVCDC